MECVEAYVFFLVKDTHMYEFGFRRQHNYAAYVGSPEPERHFSCLVMVKLMSHGQSSAKTKGSHQSKTIKNSSKLLRGYALLHSSSHPPPSKTPVPRPVSVERWLVLDSPHFLSATTEGFRPTGLIRLELKEAEERLWLRLSSLSPPSVD